MNIELGKIKKQSLIDLVNDRNVEKEYYFVKKMVLDSTTYPELSIEKLDLCPHSSEEFDVWIKICVTISKDQLFDLLKVANSTTNFELEGEGGIEDDEVRYPAKLTIETFPTKRDFLI